MLANASVCDTYSLVFNGGMPEAYIRTSVAIESMHPLERDIAQVQTPIRIPRSIVTTILIA